MFAMLATNGDKVQERNVRTRRKKQQLQQKETKKGKTIAENQDHNPQHSKQLNPID